MIDFVTANGEFIALTITAIGVALGSLAHFWRNTKNTTVSVGKAHIRIDNLEKRVDSVSEENDKLKINLAENYQPRDELVREFARIHTRLDLIVDRQYGEKK